MKKLLAIALLLASVSAFAGNGIDANCPKLTYKSAPQVKADQYICHQEYAIAYSNETHDPIYTTEFLSADHTGNLPRSNDFRVDPAVTEPNAASPNDYHNSGTACGPISGKRTSSCDQGHMTPDQDFSACDVCVHESFFMSNMVPQNYKNNEIIWKFMEIHIRLYVKSHPGGVYVVTGPIFLANHPRVTIGKDKVWVPDYLFKVVIDAQTGKTIAFSMPNAPEPTTDLPKFVVPLSVIEQVTGITFDLSLNKAAVGDYTEWFGKPKK